MISSVIGSSPQSSSVRLWITPEYRWVPAAERQTRAGRANSRTNIRTNTEQHAPLWRDICSNIIKSREPFQEKKPKENWFEKWNFENHQWKKFWVQNYSQYFIKYFNFFYFKSSIFEIDFIFLRGLNFMICILFKSYICCC